jgi:hypothetical protein
VFLCECQLRAEVGLLGRLVSKMKTVVIYQAIAKDKGAIRPIQYQPFIESSSLKDHTLDEQSTHPDRIRQQQQRVSGAPGLSSRSAGPKL